MKADTLFSICGKLNAQKISLSEKFIISKIAENHKLSISELQEICTEQFGQPLNLPTEKISDPEEESKLKEFLRQVEGYLDKGKVTNFEMQILLSRAASLEISQELIIAIIDSECVNTKTIQPSENNDYTDNKSETKSLWISSLAKNLLIIGVVIFYGSFLFLPFYSFAGFGVSTMDWLNGDLWNSSFYNAMSDSYKVLFTAFFLLNFAGLAVAIYYTITNRYIGVVKTLMAAAIAVLAILIIRIFTDTSADFFDIGIGLVLYLLSFVSVMSRKTIGVRLKKKRKADVNQVRQDEEIRQREKLLRFEAWENKYLTSWYYIIGLFLFGIILFGIFFSS